MSVLSRSWPGFFTRKGSLSRRGSRPRLSLETLEDRSLLSISVPPPGTSGPVIITGTPGSDHFMIRLEPPAQGAPGAMVGFSDNGGASFAFVPLANVTSVTVNGMGGLDTLVLDNSIGLIGKAGGLTITWNGGIGFDRLLVTGNGDANIKETYSVG